MATNNTKDPFDYSSTTLFPGTDYMSMTTKIVTSGYVQGNTWQPTGQWSGPTTAGLPGVIGSPGPQGFSNGLTSISDLMEEMITEESVKMVTDETLLKIRVLLNKEAIERGLTTEKLGSVKLNFD